MALASRELDKWIAENVMGWECIEGVKAISEFEKQPQNPVRFHRKRIWFKDGQRVACEECGTLPSYTESISDAFKVVEKMHEMNWGFTLECFAVGGSRAVFGTENVGAAEITPLAICLAAKKAIEKGGERK